MTSRSTNDVPDDPKHKKPFRFFKIILNVKLRKLRIPDEFANKFVNELTPFVTLTVPTGVSWKVIVSKSKNKLYFHEGWARFMEDNCIENGYFLVFEYSGNRHFQVHVIDMSCSEIDYPCSEVHPCPRKEESLCQVKMEVDAETEVEEEQVETEVEEDEVETEVAEDEDETEEEEEEECVASFSIVVKKYHLEKWSYMHIPQSFGKKYMSKSTNKSVKLQANNGREWVVQCCLSKPGFRLVGEELKKFTRDWNWSIGDEYNFKMVSEKGAHLVLQVTKV